MYKYSDIDEYTDKIRAIFGSPEPYRFNVSSLKLIIDNIFRGKVNFILSPELFECKSESEVIYPINFISDDSFEFNLALPQKYELALDEVSRINNYRIAYLLGVLLLEISSTGLKANQKIRDFYLKKVLTDFFSIESARFFAQCLLMPKFKVKELVLNYPFSVTEKEGGLLVMRELIIGHDANKHIVRYVSTDAFAKFFEIPCADVVSRLTWLGLIDYH